MTGAERNFRAFLVAVALAVLLVFVVGLQLIDNFASRSMTLQRFNLAITSMLPLCAVLAYAAARAIRGGQLTVKLLKLLVFGLMIVAATLLINSAGGSELQTLSAIYTAGFGLLFLLLMVFHRQALKARYGLKFFWPSQALTFRAMADVVIAGGSLERLTPDELLLRTEQYFNSFQSRRKSQIKLVLSLFEYLPLLFLNVPFSWMGSVERVAYIRRHFSQSSGMLRDMIRGLNQLCYMAYYSDPKTFPITGFVPFEERRRFQDIVNARQSVAPLSVTRAAKGIQTIVSDYCIIGSGAAGSVLAARLAEKGHKVTVVEKGAYLQPEKDFSNREQEMIARLYIDGGLQLTQDFDMSILQGACLGGTTVINNGICFDIPERVLDQWDELGLRLDRSRLAAKFQLARQTIQVTRIDPEQWRVNGGTSRFFEGIRQLGLKDKANFLDVNFKDCLGSGYCNIGCRYNRKMSMLLTYLPIAARHGTDFFSAAEVEKIEHEGGSARGVYCKAQDGTRFFVNARNVIVAAGAIASSRILLASGISRNVGSRLSFNVATPMHAEFESPLDSYDGIQMAAYLEHEGILLENTFNPPAASALIMPGWFEDHFQRMTRYRYLATAAPVVGSAANGALKRGLLGGYEVDYAMSDDDFGRLKQGMRLLSRVYLRARARAVFPSTFDTRAIGSEDDIERILAEIRRPEDVALTSAHPQGGNPMSDNTRLGAVGSDFRVHGFDNLFVCDASVFPTSVKVNPQLTILAMAEYAAETI